jgi:hypothetical protein
VRLQNWAAASLLLFGCERNPHIIGFYENGALPGDDATTGASGAPIPDRVPSNLLGGRSGEDEGEVVCPNNCTGGCENGTCKVVPGPDGAVPTCAAGMPCEVECFHEESCANGVQCGDATTCQVSCTGTRSCMAGISCGSARSCSLVCTGTGACGAIRCTDSDECRLLCTGGDSCFQGIACGAGRCDVSCGGENSCTGELTCRNSCHCAWQCLPGSGCAQQNPSCPEGCASVSGCTATTPECDSCQ